MSGLCKLVTELAGNKHLEGNLCVIELAVVSQVTVNDGGLNARQTLTRKPFYAPALSEIK